MSQPVVTYHLIVRNIRCWFLCSLCGSSNLLKGFEVKKCSGSLCPLTLHCPDAPADLSFGFSKCHSTVSPKNIVPVFCSRDCKILLSPGHWTEPVMVFLFLDTGGRADIPLVSCFGDFTQNWYCGWSRVFKWNLPLSHLDKHLFDAYLLKKCTQGTPVSWLEACCLQDLETEGSATWNHGLDVLARCRSICLVVGLYFFIFWK